MHADGPLLHAVILKNTCVPGPEERCGMKAKGGRFLSFPREFAAVRVPFSHTAVSFTCPSSIRHSQNPSFSDPRVDMSY